MKQYPAIITASQLAKLAAWPTGATEALVTFSYCDGPIPYTARVKVSRLRGVDSPRVVCGYCLTSVQALYKHPVRIGLCCGDCRNKAAGRIERDEAKAESASKPKVRASA